MMKVLAGMCQVLRRRLEETATELQATWIALEENGIVLTVEEMSAARAAIAEVTELELAMRPELVAERAELRRLFEESEKLEKELAEIDKLEEQLLSERARRVE